MSRCRCPRRRSGTAIRLKASRCSGRPARAARSSCAWSFASSLQPGRSSKIGSSLSQALRSLSESAFSACASPKPGPARSRHGPWLRVSERRRPRSRAPAARGLSGVAMGERRARRRNWIGGRWRRPEEAELRGLTEVAVVQAADFGKLQDLSRRRRLDGPEVWGVLVEREVGSGLMVVGEIAGQDAAEVSLAEDEHVIQALASDRADEPLGERVLPRALRRRENLLDSHALHAMPELLTIDLVTIPDEVGGGGVVRESGDELLSGPVSGGMLGDVEVDYAPAVVGKHNENEQDTEANGGHGEEVDRD